MGQKHADPPGKSRNPSTVRLQATVRTTRYVSSRRRRDVHIPRERCQQD